MTRTFAKMVTIESINRYLVKNQNVAPSKIAKSSNLRETYNEQQLLFRSDCFKINITAFHSKYSSIVDQIGIIGKRIPDVREHVLQTFSKVNAACYYQN